MSTLDSVTLDARLDRWRRNLIDTSLRNRLINFKETAGCLRLVSPDPQSIHHRLVVSRGTFDIGSTPASEGASDSGDRLQPGQEGQVVERSLLALRLKARTAQREQGVNILFISIGVLEWQDLDGQKVRSPLLMVPVELQRGGPLQPYKVSALDEQVVMNPILAHKLRTDYGLELPVVPEDPAERSVGDLLEAVREVIKRSSWMVTDETYLGLFAFAKMTMYEELASARDLAREHPVVRAMAGCSDPLPTPSAPTADKLDEWESPSQAYQILDADSSQQEAIALAKQGASFVLQGPPGTGKSQTIANIIAESLARGRTVLFVSEKMAALEVVKRRLDDRGLGDFCLELHSHKANKQEVVAELGRCLQPSFSVKVKDEDLSRLEEVRSKLNEHVRALHQERDGIGLSFYDIQCQLVSLRAAPDLFIDLPNLSRMSSRDLEALGPLIKEVEKSAPGLATARQHPWRDCLVDSWKVTARSEMEHLLTNLLSGLGSVSETASMVADRYGLARPSSLQEVSALIAQMRMAASTSLPLPHWLDGDPSALLAKVEEMQQAYNALGSRMAWLRDRYNENVLTFDLMTMSRRFANDYAKASRLFRRDYWHDMSVLRSLYRLGRLDRESAAADLVVLAEIGKQAARVHHLEEACRSLFGSYFSGANTNWEVLRRSLRWSKSYWEQYGSPKEGLLRELIFQGGERPIELLGQLDRVEVEVLKLERSIHLADRSFDIARLLAGRTIHELPLARYSEWAKAHLDQIGRFQEWVELNRLQKRVWRSGLSDLLIMAERGGLPKDRLWEAVRKRYYSQWHDLVLSSDATLRNFRSEEQAEAVHSFRTLDRKQMDLASLRLQALLSGRREALWNNPSPEQGTALWVLKHEMNRKKGLKPLRELFGQAGEAILQLKPCLLMSPLSVSMFLDPSMGRFDVVIFDEASQIRPEDAIGSIMRGRQVIIVGDAKQLPPTDFFRVTAEEDEEGVPDLESILDECSSCLPQRMLLWHYRSEDESLIAFSNRHFYGGRLNTFPSARAGEERGVTFVHVPEGCYDRGGSRRNLAEAKRVVDLVLEHFENAADRSLGVVAFSEAQQMAVLEELEERLKARPKLAPFFREGGEEEFFVKNLENIQGDERDVMIFSLGYGKDTRGKMLQNFGPLNRAGGERRLNVAITRARKKVVVVSSLLPEEIEPTSVGSELLQKYMEYAVSAGRPAEVVGKDCSELTALEEDMRSRLTERGLKVTAKIGCSGYRLDLAVEDPETPGRYLLGIESDGPGYRSGRTARDRERLRQEALQRLGWKLHRVWSSDWVRDSQGELDQIARMVEESRAEALCIVAEKAVAEAEAPEMSVSGTPEEGDEVLVPAVPVAAASAPACMHGQPYKRVAWSDHRDLIARFKAHPEEAVREAVEQVVKEEGPVHPLIVHDRLKELTKVAGSRKRSLDLGKCVSEAAADLTSQGRVLTDGTFLWPLGMDTPPLRTTPGPERRELWYVCMKEVELAVMSVVEDAGAVEEKALVTRTAAIYGYRRPSPEARSRIHEAVEHLLEEGRLERDGEVLRRAC